MKIAVFSSQKHDKDFLSKANEKYKFEISYFKELLHEKNAIIAKGFDVVCCFTNDEVNEKVIQILKQNGIKIIAIRATGINNVDLKAAKKANIKVVNVPGYSPHSVAEFTIGIMLTLIRRINKASTRIKDLNFSLEGLIGEDIFGKTVGVIGMGKIGQIVANLLVCFGCEVLAYDPKKKSNTKENGILYSDLEKIYKKADIITLHCPLTQDNKHMINSKTLKLMKDGVIIINTARGALIDSSCLIENLKSGKISYLAMDVYEEEENIFSKDLSTSYIPDDIFAILLNFPNVLITAHQAFFTKNAMNVISNTTLDNIDKISKNEKCVNEQTAKI
ncbi:MAG: 2-hydroxyacid dehydrogenase [Parachlamydiales bacterium]|nr:2-hydroxyacid dehydrogenase [Parachlamydiales bacterium]